MQNHQNKIVVTLSYDRLTEIGEVYLGEKNRSYYLLNKSGKVIRHYEYTYMMHSNDYLIAMDKNNLYGVIDVNRRIIVPFKHSNLRSAGGYYFATPEVIYDTEGKRVLNGGYTRSTYTNNLKLRRGSIFLLTGFADEIFSDRCGNRFDPKKPVQESFLPFLELMATVLNIKGDKHRFFSLYYPLCFLFLVLNFHALRSNQHLFRFFFALFLFPPPDIKSGNG